MSEEKEFRVVIPEEKIKGIGFKQKGLPGIAEINISLVDFEPKEVFSWHFSILIEAKEIDKEEIPTKEEADILYTFEDKIDPIIKSNGNAMFFARVTHSGNYELIYRVYDPEPIEKFMKKLIKESNHPRYFDYRIDQDEEWEKTEWYIKAITP